jgi:ribosome-binding factor A
MSHIRPKRVESILHEEIASVFLQERIRDPRLQGRITVTEVEVSKDLRHAKVYVSHLGDPAQEGEVFAALAGATGFVQSCIAQAVRLRFVPKVVFIPDHSIERGVNLVHKINTLVKPSAGADSSQE